MPAGVVHQIERLDAVLGNGIGGDAEPEQNAGFLVRFLVRHEFFNCWQILIDTINDDGSPSPLTV
jgi:hypothetical protein